MSSRPRNRLELGALSRPASQTPKAKPYLMSMLRKIAGAFELPPAPPSSAETDDMRIMRSTVAEHSHGNIHLQMGDYYTKEDLDKEVSEVKGFDFTPRAPKRGK